MSDDDPGIAGVSREEDDGSNGDSIGQRLPGYDPPIQPESPALENVVFVLLGVLVALATVIRLVQLLG